MHIQTSPVGGAARAHALCVCSDLAAHAKAFTIAWGI